MYVPTLPVLGVLGSVLGWDVSTIWSAQVLQEEVARWTAGKSLEFLTLRRSASSVTSAERVVLCRVLLLSTVVAGCTGEAHFCASAFSYVLRSKNGSLLCHNFHSLEASRLALRPSLCASCGLKF